MKPPTDAASGAAWRPFRRRHRLRQMARPSRRLGLWHGAALNDMLFRCASALGLPYWSLSAWLKHKVKNAVEYISRFEESWRTRPRARGVDGVVCGHIHHAEIRLIGDVLYLNDGDWVESCSALVEDARGNMEILRWASPSSETRPAHGRHAGRRTRACSRVGPASADRRGRIPRRGRRAFEDPDRHRRLGAAGQWRGAHPGNAGRGSGRAGPRRALRHAEGRFTWRCRPIRKSAWRCFRARPGEARSANSRPTRCISPPKARWG